MITEQLDFTGRVAIVTGGATGIGYATALQLARLGASTVICSRTVDELEAAAARIREASGKPCLAVPTDVKDEEAVTRMVERAVAEFGRIDVLVNNAGGTRMGPLEKIPTRGWDSIFDLNVRSAYFCTREAGKHMIEQRSGAIVNISSGAGVNGVKGGAHYSAAKSALQMFTRVTAAEWGRYGIRANCVAAGAIASERVLGAWKVAGLEPETMGAAIPLGRTGTPDEMANMIVFFASDAASYITGETISVSGGPALGGIQLD
jgi:3-oxoacyl-[acyl-carrier protein] reductase